MTRGLLPLSGIWKQGPADLFHTTSVAPEAAPVPLVFTSPETSPAPVFAAATDPVKRTTLGRGRSALQNREGDLWQRAARVWEQVLKPLTSSQRLEPLRAFAV